MAAIAIFPSTATEPSLEQRLIESLPIAERIVRVLGRRYCLPAEERDEFLSLVRLRLIQDDYAILRRFEGRSTLSTYLRTVIGRLFLDERVKTWGRWRPSAQAARLGPAAVALERLLEGQHLSIDEAIQAQLAADPHAREDVLRSLAQQLPRRSSRRLVDDSVLAHVAAPGPGPDARVERAAARRIRAQVAEALRGVAAALPARTRLLLKLRFAQNQTVADVSRTLGCDQKPLYRELDRALAHLRRGIEARGISAAQVRAVIAAGSSLSETQTLS
jgi:RNA polymerase sigma factor (sigma-70 family)